MTGDRLIRASTAAVVTAVAAFAAVVSYSHIYDLGRAHGQSGTAARLLPLSVDGLILAASLVMLHEARNRRQAPPLARFMLALGVAATVAANMAYGSGYGTLGAVISAWPAVAFIGAVEMVMGMVRRARQPTHQLSHSAVTNSPPRGEDLTPKFDSPAVPARVPLPTHRQVREEYSCGPATAKKIRAAMVKATSNGHAPKVDA